MIDLQENLIDYISIVSKNVYLSILLRKDSSY